MEFLITYGWVILVVIIAIGSLSYFGILKADRFLPERCSLSAGIMCLDFEVESSKVVLVIQNSFGYDISIEEVVAAKKDDGSCSNSERLVLENNQKAIITISDCNNGDVKNRYNGDLNITYTKEGSLFHVAKGTIIAKISGESITSSSTICQNAEDSGLCGGLDMVFGVGYRDLCCSDHDLCC